MSPEQLIAAIEAGDIDTVRRLVIDATDPQRRACMPVVRAYERDHREQMWTAQAPLLWSALQHAKLGCATDARTAERLLRTWLPEEILEPLADLTLQRNPKWFDTVYARMIDDLGEWGQLWPVVERLRIGSGRERPRTDAYLTAFMRFHTNQIISGDAEALSLIPAILNVGGIGATMWGDMPSAIAGHVKSGAIDRGEVVAAAFQALMRGGRPGELRPFIKILDTIGLSQEELAAKRADLVRLLAAPQGFVASFGMGALRRLDKAGQLPDDTLIEVARIVFARPEKGLATATLTMVASRTKSAEQVDQWVAAVSDGLAHVRADVQEAVLKLLGKVWPSVSPEMRERVGFAADAVAPRLRVAAAELLGQSAAPSMVGLESAHAFDVPPHTDVAPLDPIASLDELVRSIARVVETSDPLEAERVFDGLVRFAVSHPADLPSAFAPLLPRLAVPSDENRIGSVLDGVASDHGEIPEDYAPLLRQFEEVRDVWPGFAIQAHGDVGVIAAVVNLLAGAPRRPHRTFTIAGAAHSASDDDKIAFVSMFEAPETNAPGTASSSPTKLRVARLQEFAEHAAEGNALGLLALPTHKDGHVDPEALVARMAAFEAAGASPWQHDFEQALLRLPRESSSNASALAGRLRSAWGKLIAERLRQGVRDPETRRRIVRKPHSLMGDTMANVTVNGIGGVDDTYGFAWCPERLNRNNWWDELWVSSWPITLPSHREVVCVHAVRLLAEGWNGESRVWQMLPSLVSMDGPVGVATCDVLLMVASTKQPARRVGATDAIIGLTCQRVLPADLFATEFAELTEHGGIVTARVAPVLADAAGASNACREWTWQMLQVALPSFLHRKAKDTHLLLALAADLVSESGVGGSIDGLAEVAAAKGSTRLIVEARRLRDALAQV